MLLLPAACDRLIAGMPPAGASGGGCREALAALDAAADEPDALRQARWHPALLEAAGALGGPPRPAWGGYPRPRAWPGRAVGALRAPTPPEAAPSVEHGPDSEGQAMDVDAAAAGELDALAGFCPRRSSRALSSCSSGDAWPGARAGGCEMRAPAVQRAEARAEPAPARAPLLRFDSVSSEAAYAQLGPGWAPAVRRAPPAPLLVVQEPAAGGGSGMRGAADGFAETGASAASPPLAPSAPPGLAQRAAADLARPACDGGLQPPLQRARWGSGLGRLAAAAEERQAVPPAAEPAASWTRHAATAPGGCADPERPGLVSGAVHAPGAGEELSRAAGAGTSGKGDGLGGAPAPRGAAAGPGSGAGAPGSPGPSAAAADAALFTEERQRAPRRRRPPPLRSATVRRSLAGALDAAADAERLRPVDSAPTHSAPPPWAAHITASPLPPSSPWRAGGGLAGKGGAGAPLKLGVAGGSGGAEGGIKAWRADDAREQAREQAGAPAPASPMGSGAWGRLHPDPGTGQGQGERTLGEVLAAGGGGALPEAAARTVAANAALALAELHADRLVHRAVGPAAVVLGDGESFDTARRAAGGPVWVPCRAGGLRGVLVSALLAARLARQPVSGSAGRGRSGRAPVAHPDAGCAARGWFLHPLERA